MSVLGFFLEFELNKFSKKIVIPKLMQVKYKELEFLDISWVAIQCLDIFSNLEQPASLLKREDLNKRCLRIVSALG